MLSIGLMSGTSMDGIDAALLDTDGSPGNVREIGHTSLTYDPPFKILLKVAEYVIRNYSGNLQKAQEFYSPAIKEYLLNELHIPLSAVDEQLNALTLYLYGEQHLGFAITLNDVIQHSTMLHAKVVKQLLLELGYKADQVDVVGYHGQCMYHQPTQKISVIVGDGQALADQVGITVVNDFRRRDIEAGGLGAPFAPLYHQALAIRDHKIPVAVVNCGGIANITLINGSGDQDLIAYDTGPGNGLIDRLVRQRTQGKENMDRDGVYGLQGVVNELVLERLYQRAIIKNGKNYFLAMPPKSLDIGDMELIPEMSALSLEDACATLEAFTAKTIILSLDLLQTQLPNHWILAGGGWNNPVIYRQLETLLRQKIGDNLNIKSADDAGWNSQAMEAQIFAYLAVRSLQNQPLSFFGTTRVPVLQSGGHAHIPKVGPTTTVKKWLLNNPQVLEGYQSSSRLTENSEQNL
jgi:anhydro-N-acetylmuramic acid kinase